MNRLAKNVWFFGFGVETVTALNSLSRVTTFQQGEIIGLL